jgi:hypothetical protein
MQIRQLFQLSYIVMDLINMLTDNSSVNMVQHAKIEEVVFSVDPTDGPKTGWIGIT